MNVGVCCEKEKSIDGIGNGNVSMERNGFVALSLQTLVLRTRLRQRGTCASNIACVEAKVVSAMPHCGAQPHALSTSPNTENKRMHPEASERANESPGALSSWRIASSYAAKLAGVVILRLASVVLV